MPPEQIREIFKVLLDKNIEVSTYDNASVMHYVLPITLFKQQSPRPTCCSDLHPTLSVADQTVIKKYYPETGIAQKSCVDDGSFLVSSLDFTREQKRALGAELTPLLAIGASAGSKVTLALKPEIHAPVFTPSAKGFAFPNEAIAPDDSHEFAHQGASDCTPEPLREKASCSLSADGGALEFSVGP